MKILREDLEVAKTLVRGDLPAGWRFLGSGIGRQVFKKGKFVYKIQSDYAWTPQNEVEAKAVWRIMKHPKRPDYLYVPRAWHDPVTKVLVMDWVPGKVPEKCGDYECSCGIETCWAWRASWMMSEMNMRDLHRKNLKIMPDGRIGVFDFGFCQENW